MNSLSRVETIEPSLSRADTRKIIAFLSIVLADQVKLDYPVANLGVIMRAGLGMLEGFIASYPEADVGFIGIKSPKTIGQPASLYLSSLPKTTAETTTILLEPVVAEAKAALLATQTLRRQAGRSVVASIVSTELGAERLAQEGVPLYSICRHDMAEDGLLIPNIGDIGDRLWGEHEG